MSVLSSLLVWAQAAPVQVPAWKWWLLVFGEPGDTIPGLLGGVITWVKAIGLFSLVGWVGAWAVTALKERKAARAYPLDIAALVALVGVLLSVVLGVSQALGRARPLNLAGQPAATSECSSTPWLVALPGPTGPRPGRRSAVSGQLSSLVSSTNR